MNERGKIGVYRCDGIRFVREHRPWRSASFVALLSSGVAVKVFELSQTLRDKWLEAGYAAKRRILEIVCLNCRLDDTTLVAIIRKPFDVLAEGLSSEDSRAERI